MKKFEFDKLTQYFNIDPAHLAAGLEAAAKAGCADVCVTAMDLRSKNLSLDAPLLAGFKGMKRLYIHVDVAIPADDVKWLEQLVDLEELTLKENGPLAYGKFKKLRKLTLMSGTALPGLDKLRALEGLYLGRWDSEELPPNLGKVGARIVRISVANKLANLEPLCAMAHLEDLMLQRLPKLQVGKEINKLKTLRELYVETAAWTDFSVLRLASLRKLFASTLDSLDFIRHLENLEDLFFWDCVDGDLSPVLEHPALKKIRFVPAKKHYTHKLAALQKALAAKNAGKA